MTLPFIIKFTCNSENFTVTFNGANEGKIAYDYDLLEEAVEFRMTGKMMIDKAGYTRTQGCLKLASNGRIIPVYGEKCVRYCRNNTVKTTRYIKQDIFL